MTAQVLKKNSEENKEIAQKRIRAQGILACFESADSSFEDFYTSFCNFQNKVMAENKSFKKFIFDFGLVFQHQDSNKKQDFFFFLLMRENGPIEINSPAMVKSAFSMTNFNLTEIKGIPFHQAASLSYHLTSDTAKDNTFKIIGGQKKIPYKIEKYLF